MKIIKIVFFSAIILVAVAIAGIWVFLKTFKIERYKAQIIAASKDALARDLDFESLALSFSLKKGIGVNLKQVAIAEDPQVGKGNFLTIGDIFVRVDFWPLLTERKISTSSIQLSSLALNIIRQKDASFNLQSIGKKEQAGGDPGGQAAGPAKAAALPLFIVESIRLSGGKINYIDKTFEPCLNIEITDLSVNAHGLSLGSVFPFQAEGVLLGAKKNFAIKGQAKIDKDNMAIKLSNVNMQADLSALALESLLKALPMLKSAGINQSPKGKVQVNISELVVGAKGLISLALSGGLSSGGISFQQLASPISDVQAKLQMDQKDLQIKDLSLVLADGKVTGAALANDYLGQQGFSADLNINNLNLAKLIDQSKRPIKLEGLLSGKASLKGQGFGPDKALESLSADAEFGIKDGKLTDINVLKSVLDKISLLPGLAAKIEAALPERYKQKLTQKDTLITRADALLSVGQKVIHITKLEMEADGFLFEGRGEADFNQQFSLSGRFYIPQDLSASMISIVKELQYLLDEQKRILIPVQVSGQGSAISFSVDLEYLGRKFFQSKGKEELEKALDKLFKKEGSQPQKEPLPQGQQAEPVVQEPPQRKDKGWGELLESVFK
ncbi:MAG: AsmA family protein [Candidatus Omnitrophica bacterium]|nr:AsmA family protein [Candidatus Omnitrophota bacterium]